MQVQKKKKKKKKCRVNLNIENASLAAIFIDFQEGGSSESDEEFYTSLVLRILRNFNVSFRTEALI